MPPEKKIKPGILKQTVCSLSSIVPEQFIIVTYNPDFFTYCATIPY
jgi:hypothetical protein